MNDSWSHQLEVGKREGLGGAAFQSLVHMPTKPRPTAGGPECNGRGRGVEARRPDGWAARPQLEE